VKLLIQPEAGIEPIVQSIKRARRAIDISIFRLDRKEVEQALGAAVARGVIVRALVAHTNRGGQTRLRKLEQRLLASGVSVSRTGADLAKYHGKYLVVDDVLHVLGFNLTSNDIARSRSFGIQTRHRRAVRDARSLFEADLTRQPYAASGRSPLVVSPETSRATLLRFIRGARKRLAIYEPHLQDRQFVEALAARAAAGVQVQMLGKASRVPDHVDVLPLKSHRLHVRAILRDGTGAFVGSQSLRAPELDRRREVGLIITNPQVTRRMLDVFDEDWRVSGGKTRNRHGRRAGRRAP
jgi:phosphatidylserine/phosphatidylglycerophosphate/cardiolipin synthase-like enzyme